MTRGTRPMHMVIHDIQHQTQAHLVDGLNTRLDQ
jgi:hypothetical protein